MPPRDFAFWAKSLRGQLNKSKGAGLDKLSSRLIRECADLISPYTPNCNKVVIEKS